MNLSRSSLKSISTASLIVPEEKIFDLPEKVLQFGTGVLLRGLPDYFIDKANRQGIFNGRIVVVKSTAQGDTAAFDRQDGLYTLCVRGIDDGVQVKENIIVSSISRVLNAVDVWEQVLAYAHNPQMQIIISNTTEVGIQLVNEDVNQNPPQSFPGKLLSFLLERYKAFNGRRQSGMIIIPTELIPDNGSKLQAIILELARFNKCTDDFIRWLKDSNTFCSSLVDRIVPGKPDAEQLSLLESELGYSDDLLTISEAYRLWAIEGDDRVKNILSFAKADAGVIIQPDINIFRELKLRLLNGTHTLSCGVAFLAGCATVREAMDHPALCPFIVGLMHQEIAPAIPYTVDPHAAREFASKVLDRFRNPDIRHQWLSITLNYSSKIKMRCIPVLEKHYSRHKAPPPLFALGFAAYLFFMKGVSHSGNKFYGVFNGQSYPIQDDQAAIFYERWATLSPEDLVHAVLQDEAFWGINLLAFPGFEEEVAGQLKKLISLGMHKALEDSVALRFSAEASSTS